MGGVKWKEQLMTYLDGGADDSSTIPNLEKIFKKCILFVLIIVELLCLQADGFGHSSTEVHYSVPGVPPLQGLVAAREPGSRADN